MIPYISDEGTPRPYLTRAEAEAMRDQAREEYWNHPHCDLNVGYARWQAAIDAIAALERKP